MAEVTGTMTVTLSARKRWFFWPALIWVAAPWLVSFPLAMLLLAVSFRR